MFMANRSKPKLLPNGRNASPRDRFVRLGHDLLKSRAYRSLSPNARSLLVELASMENGDNNGALWLSEDDAARRMGVACPKVARKALQELSEVGFIAMTKNAYFNVKLGEGRARSWRLTWLFNVAQRMPASNEWREAVPSGNAALKRMDRGLRALSDYRKNLPQKQNAEGKSPDTTAIHQSKQGNSPDTPILVDEIPPFCDEVKQGDLPPHTAVAIGSGEAGLGWWHRDAELTAHARIAYYACLMGGRPEIRLAA